MKGYVIAIVDVHDPEAYKEYSALVPGTLEPYGGRFIARAAQHQVLEGDIAASRFVIIEFDSYEKALEWYNSDNYQVSRLKRLSVSKASIIVVQGV